MMPGCASRPPARASRAKNSRPFLIHALGQQQFQGDLAPETVLLRFPDLAHAPAAETLDQGEVAQHLARGDTPRSAGGGYGSYLGVEESGCWVGGGLLWDELLEQTAQFAGVVRVLGAEGFDLGGRGRGVRLKEGGQEFLGSWGELMGGYRRCRRWEDREVKIRFPASLSGGHRVTASP